MHRASIVFATLLTAACSTHQVERCLPPCGSADQTFFARCVADGLAGECQAGNRRCCALAAECVGPLDDQVVETTAPDCAEAEEDQCWPACDASDASQFDFCLGMGSSLCSPGDDVCCALEADCLGTLGDVIVYADGCCTESSDCARGQRCDPSTSACVQIIGCGDGIVSPDEECDDRNDVLETCAYGEMSCVVCAPGCVEQPGAVRFCGDGVLDSADGEDCEPPGTRACDANCFLLTAPACENGADDGNETDVDCGGADCPPCGVGQGCLVPSDCVPGLPECSAVTDCGAEGLCIERNACDDGSACTVDSCLPVEGCNSELLDVDGDTFGPEDIGCGGDCDDNDSNVSPRAPELCDGIDNNCDRRIDEIC